MAVALKKWSRNDKEKLIEICNKVDRTYLAKDLPAIYMESDADEWFNMVEECDGVDGVYRAIFWDGKPVGEISVIKKYGVYGCDAEIGYLLSADICSKGVMTEAVRQMCNLAFSELNILRLTGLVYAPNTASRRVLEKNDFIIEGIMKNAVSQNGKIYDLCIYGKQRG